MQDLMTKDASSSLGISQRQVAELLRLRKLSESNFRTTLASVAPLDRRTPMLFHTGAGRTWSASS